MELRGIPPMQMNGNLAENWRFWKQRFNTYLKATELEKKSEPTKCAQLLTYIGDEGIRIYNTFSWEEGQLETLKILEEKFDSHFNPKKNLTFERYKFFTCRQEEGQTIDQFITNLKNFSLSCEFGTLRDSLIKDILVCGLRSSTLRERLLQEDAATLEKAVQVCLNMENTKHQSRQIGNGINNEHKEVDTVDFRKLPKFQNPRAGPSRYSQMAHQLKKEDNRICQKCFRQHGFKKCPAFGKRCHKCGNFNHFSNCCRNKQVFPNKNRESNVKSKKINCLLRNDNADTSNDFLFIGSIDCMDVNSTTSDISGDAVGSSENSWVTTLEINKHALKFKMDTGSMANLIPVSFLKDIDFDCSEINVNNVQLTSYTGHKVPVLGKCYLRCRSRFKTISLLFYIVATDHYCPILGLEACVELGLIRKIDHIEHNLVERDEYYKNILNEYKTVFEGIGCLKKEYNIELKKDAIPVTAYPRKVPLAIKDKLKHTLNELEKQGLIERSNDCSDWCHNMVIVRKPNNQLRIALDPKDLNASIKRHPFLIPTLEDLTAKLSGSRYFSVLDATQGFLQIKLSTESSKLCTFATPFGRYRFLRLPYGICSAPEIFQERMSEIFGEVEGCSFYIDDLLIFGNTIKEHDERLKQVLELAKINNLKFNKNKCKFLKTEVEYMGHIIGKDGIKPSFDKVQAIKDMPPPQNKKDVQRFLGMITYMSKFIHNLSEKTTPLRALLKKESVFLWGQVEEKAFKTLKDILSNTPYLHFYDVTKNYATISVDASQHGMAAVLTQDGRPCAQVSRALTETQCRYSQIEKEMLAVWFGITRFSQLVYGIENLTVETDHLPLVNIIKKPLHLCPPRLQRMLIQLRKYNFKLVYIPGKNLILPDTLSRAFPKDKTFDENIDVELNSHICLIQMNINVSPEKRQKIIEQTKKDPELKILKEFVRNGWPRGVRDCPQNVKFYFKFRHEILEIDELLFKGSNLIVPKALRQEILNKLH